MSELPPGWTETSLGDVLLELRNGVFVSRPGTEETARPILRISAVRPMTLRLDDVRYLPASTEVRNETAYGLEKGDLLFTRYSGNSEYVGACARVRQETAYLLYPDKLIRGRVIPGLVDAAYVEAMMTAPSARATIRRLVKTTAGQVGISGSDLRSLRLPLAPYREQVRIVATIEEQFSRVDAGVTALQRVTQNLKRMRAAVLEAAVTGRLPSSQRTGLANDNLPPDWRLVTVGDVAEVSGGITKNPKRKPQKNVVPFLRVANVPRDSLDLQDVHTVEVFDGELERMRLRAGDLLVVEGNGSPDQIGRSALWHGEIDPCVHQNHLIRVRPKERVLPEYLNLYWNAPSSMATIQAAASSTSGLHTLSTGKVRSIPVALPPVDIQELIVNEVKRQLSFVQTLEGELQAMMKRSHRLRSSILAVAFAGSLVPQDLADEPASVLLERIATKRAVSDGRRPNTKRTSRTKVTA